MSVDKRKSNQHRMVDGTSMSVQTLESLHAKIARGEAIGEFDRIVRGCRGCRNIGPGETCVIYRCPMAAWEGRACRSRVAAKAAGKDGEE